MLPEREKKTVAYSELVLAPERRRAGSGTALFAHCADRARAAGRTRLRASVPDGTGIEPRAWDAERIRNLEQAIMATGTEYCTVVARHGATGQLVAITQMAVDPQLPDWAVQQVTAVRPEHRGHRLGLLAKIAMLDLPADREPAVRRILAGNAGGNHRMIAINELPGYRITQTLRNWELDLAG